MRKSQCTKPEVHDGILIQLTPDIQHTEHHRIHEQREIADESDDDAAYPVEQQEKTVIRRLAIVLASL